MRATLYILIAIAALFSSFLEAEAQNRFKAFEYADTLQLNQKMSSSPTRHYINLNTALLDHSLVSLGDVISIEYDSAEYEFTIKKVVSYVPNTYTYVAHTGLRYLYLTISRELVTAVIHLPDVGVEAVISYDAVNKMSFIEEHDHSTELTCGNHLVENQLIDQVNSQIESFRVSKGSDLVNKMQSPTEETTIKLMIVYSNGALSWINSTSSVENIINQSMALAQEALDVSDTKVILDLVHTAHVQFDESGIGASDLLANLRINGDGKMDEIHFWREFYEVDIVSMLAFINDVGGIGYRVSTPEGDERLGFNVNRVQQVATSYTLIHEIGHNMGNAHSRNQSVGAASPAGGVFTYSTGWRWIGNDDKSYASVMTYESSPIDGVVSIRTPHFSNPDITFKGVPTGSFNIGEPFAPADNARSMREMREAIAAYRPKTDTGLPTITSVNPAWGARGTSVSVLFRGTNFDKVSNISWMCPNAGALQATSAVIESPMQLRVVWNISLGAMPGECAVTLWTGLVNLSNFVTSQFTITEFTIDAPTVTTTEVTTITSVAATTGGTVTFDGGHPVTARGVCFSTSENPTTDNFCTSAGTGDGAFSIELFSLTPSTTYYIRAYAANIVGIAYGQQLVFETDDPIVNNPPTVDTIADRTISTSGPFEIEIPLSGITAGDDETDQQILLTARSSDSELLQVEVDYETPQSTGLLRISGDGTRFGLATVSVIAKDTGGIDFGGMDSTVVTFEIQVVMETTIESDSDVPGTFHLDQNYPNPFNPSTQISFSLPKGAHVDLAVFDMIGRRVTQLVDAYTAAGTHRVTFDSGSLPSGVYMYVIQAGGVSATGKMTLIK